MGKPHTDSAFESDIQHLLTLVATMGARVDTAVDSATRAFVDRDQTLAQRVVADDEKIDALEDEINAAVVRMLALRQPRASDLRQVVTLMKVAGDLERLGDYAKNLAKRVPVLHRSDMHDGAVSAVRRLSDMVRRMLKDGLAAYDSDDITLARAVLARDVEVDQATDALFRMLLTHMMEDPRSITVSMHLMFIAKNFERMGDHVTEICEAVIYLETGEMPEPREKGASTSAIADPADSANQT
ncbi:MAG: phosphate signaling complex protein PhoU [Paracoccaceae bacterium]